MARKPFVDHNNVKVWRVYDGSESRAYWFALDGEHTEDGDENQFDVRDLVTMKEEDYRKAKKAIIEAIDMGHLTQTGIVPTVEQLAEEAAEVAAYETDYKNRWEAMLERFR